MRQTRKKPCIAFHMPAIGGALNPAYCCPYHAAARRAGTAQILVTLSARSKSEPAVPACRTTFPISLTALSNCFSRRIRAPFSADVRAPIPYLRLFRAEVTLNQQKSMMEHLLQSGRKEGKVSKMGISLP